MDVLLYATENPRNLGSIIRTSVGFGLTKLHIYDEHHLLENPADLELMNAVCRRNRWMDIDMVKVADVGAFIDQYEHRYATVLSTRSKFLGIDNLTFEEDSLIVFGCESKGLPREISTRNGIVRFAIPTVNPVECFGLAEAYSMVVFAYLMQHPKEFPKYA